MAMTQERREALKSLLEERLQTLKAEVESSSRRVSDDTAEDDAEAQIQDDIHFALIQMKSDTITKLEDGLKRLEKDEYGNCYECGGEIAEGRLRALPFALRCKPCEEKRELEAMKARQRRPIFDTDF